MLTIKCAACKSKIFKYQKIGKGKILTCWDSRIIKDYSIRENGHVKCICGKTIGTEVIKGIRMKQGNFTYSGTITKK
ncbi:MAG: hypothetical protein B6D64_03740 [Bacteroidetes bacterium 4484_276]|nr:MAG: hypothetical protein B6D64_03740 [Bacteroidetes bacterium 4484_276]